ncbi:MAG: hypothetical protein AAF658_09280 [Myxococcota bacterium]
MTSALLILLGTLIPASVPEARLLYDEALYEEALEALGPSCDATADPVVCEEIRAFIYIALGREADASATFERMLSLDPSAALSGQVAPKIRSLFDSRQAAIAELFSSELEPVAVEEDVPSPVKFVARGDVELLTVTLVVRPETDEPVERISMQLEDGAWVAMVTLEEPDEAKHSIELELAAGALVSLGGADPVTPFQIRGTAEASPLEPDWLDADEPSDDEALPAWAWWSIIGGGVVVTGVVLALVLGGGSGDGNVVVDVTFDGAPP